MPKKRYYQGKKDRMDESKGMKKYEEMEKKRPYESKDRFEFGNDYSAPQNMPMKVIMRDFPKAGYSIDGYYPDDLAGVDMQIDSDASTVRENAGKGEKY